MKVWIVEKFMYSDFLGMEVFESMESAKAWMEIQPEGNFCELGYELSSHEVLP